jgi:hypothetical protein
MLRGQTVTPVQFPQTDETAISDCSTPTTLTLSDGTTVTFRGGQFIHYEDENFFGTMYATNSAAGCQRTGPDFDLLKHPVTEVTITFSKPIPKLEVQTYNLNGPTGQWDGPNPGMGVFFWDAAGNTLAAYGRGFPPRLMNPDPFPYPIAAWPPVSMITFQTWTAEPVPPDKITFTPRDWNWAITSLALPQGPADFVKFDFTEAMSGSDDGKILLSKAGWDVTYPSMYQLPTTSNMLQVKVTGLLINGTTKQPKAGTVHLRVDDPADTALYRTGDARTGDNDGFLATLGGAANGIAKVQADAQGKFEAVLSITSHTAGDNYQIAGSANDKFDCPAGPCPRSGAFTLWKRVYVEEEHMFRQGAFIEDLAPANATQIPVADAAPFQGLARGTTLELVHADSGNGEGFYADLVMFKTLTQQANGQWMVEVDATTPLPRAYGAPTTRNPIDRLRRDGVGIASSGVYEPNAAYVASLFASMFVDVVPARQTVSDVPYVRELDQVQRIYYASRWLQDATSPNRYSTLTNPNVYHRIGATQSPLVAKAGGVGAELGVTSVTGGSNHSFVFVQRIEDLAAARLGTVGAEYGGLSSVVINAETTTHETVHLWVHDRGADGSGHCVEVAYRSGLNCLMHTPYIGPGLADGLVELHYVQHGADSEYMTVRRALDPVPQH